EVAAVERQIFDLRPADELAERRAAGLDAQAGRAGDDTDRFGNGADLQREIDLRILPDGELHGQAGWLKAGQLRCDLVDSDVLVWKRVPPALVTDRVARQVRGHGPHDNQRSGQHRARAIPDDA